jgi:hypothetical protein
MWPVLQDDSKWTLICLNYYDLIENTRKYSIIKNI